MKINNKFKKGFTLIELLVVIAIIGILTALSIFGLIGARTSSRDAKRRADLEQIRSGLEIFKADCNKYYVGSSLPSPLVGVPSYSSSCLASNTYISSVPTDPVAGRSYTYKSVDGSGYYLCASLEQAPNPPASATDLSNCPACGGTGCNYVVKNP